MMKQIEIQGKRYAIAFTFGVYRNALKEGALDEQGNVTDIVPILYWAAVFGERKEGRSIPNRLDFEALLDSAPVQEAMQAAEAVAQLIAEEMGVTEQGTAGEAVKKKT